MRSEAKENAVQRIKDALEFLESAKDNLDKERFKASVDNAVDAVIAANDAFTISLIQQMPTSDHQEAVRLHKEAGKKINLNQSPMLKQLLDLASKNIQTCCGFKGSCRRDVEKVHQLRAMGTKPA